MPNRKNRLSAALLQRLRAFARDLAAAAGGRVRERQRRGGITRNRKGVGDFVTEVDVATERALRRDIAAVWPDHGILGEELPAIRPDAEFVWILDPIDGTSNFAAGMTTYAVSLACLHRGTPVAAAVHVHPDDATYHAALGQGAFCGRQRLELVRDGGLDDASMLGVQWHRTTREFDFLAELMQIGTRVRNLGSTVVQLAEVAAGRLDANVQEQGKIWDFAAAALLVTEAGGRFTDWSGRDVFPLRELDGDRHYPSVAAHPTVHRALCRRLRQHEASIVVPDA